MKFNNISNRPTAGTEIYDRNFVRLDLTHVGGGGEADVFTCPQRPGQVVKVYRTDLVAGKERRQDIADRLQALASKRMLANSPSFAWPVEAVYEKGGNLAGYIMRRIPEGYVRLTSLFGGVKAVKHAFPNWTRRDLAETALNFVATIQKLQVNGVMPVDWNPQNFLVDASHHVVCIDCDSYQVYDGSGKCFTSSAYFESMAAPELLWNPGLKGQPRTEAQTCWSVALMVYRLLMAGMHPFQYVDESGGTVAASVVDNIKAGMCPLGYGAGCRFAPVWAPLWSYLTGKLKDMFITTFRREDNHGWGDPAFRAPLEMQHAEIKRFIYEMGRMPQRAMLEPSDLKSNEYLRPQMSDAPQMFSAHTDFRPNANQQHGFGHAHPPRFFGGHEGPRYSGHNYNYGN